MPQFVIRSKFSYERLPRMLLGKRIKELVALLLIPTVVIAVWFLVRSSESTLAIDVAVISVTIVATEFAIAIWQRSSKGRDELAEDFRKYGESLGLDIKDDHPWSNGMRSRLAERMEIQREHREVRSAMRSAARQSQSPSQTGSSYLWKIAVVALGIAIVSLRRSHRTGSKSGNLG